MRRDGGAHENFFIAKTRDSKSAPRASACNRSVAVSGRSHHSCNARITETSAAQAFPAILTIAGTESSGTIRIACNKRRPLVDARALRALTLSRQHFLKPDAVFFDVLVYSGCSAFRFPNARSELKPSHYIRRATWPRKLRRQRRRRAQ